MRKLIAVLLFLTGFIFQVVAQKSAVLIEFKDEKITTSEFQRIYRKNNAETPEYSAEDIKEYLDLYINFKLKVKEAEALGYDTAKSFISELSGYRKQLSQPYFIDNTVTDQLVEEAYERLKKEVNAAHILIRLEGDASPADTLNAYKKVLKIKKEIESGFSFEDAAKKYSEDPSAASNGGDLGYFSAFQMVYPFEDAAFNTPIGRVSNVVRTRFGYHLIYVKDIRPSRGEVRTAHIMIKSRANDEEKLKLEAKSKIDEIHGKLKAGEEFSALAEMYSEDGSSARKGGELPWFGSGRMVPEFEDAAFSLAAIGDYSEPFLSSYGWHIVLLLEKKGLQDFAEMKEEIKRKVERDGRGAKSKTIFIEGLKAEYGYNVNTKALNEIVKSMDEGFYNGTWKASEKVKTDKALFNLDASKYDPKKQMYTQQHFAKFIESSKKHRTKIEGFTFKMIVDDLLSDYSEKVIMEFEDNILEAKHEDFRNLMKEYRDGILLFELMDNMVWTKAVKDTAGLAEYYEANKTNFMWPERYQAIFYSCNNATTAKATRKAMKKRARKAIPLQEIRAKINTNSELNLTTDSALFVKGKEPRLDVVPLNVGVSENFDFNGRVVFAEVIEILQPEPKRIDEARGAITAEYQNYLERTWMEGLRTKYKYSVNEALLKTIK